MKKRKPIILLSFLTLFSCSGAEIKLEREKKEAAASNTCSSGYLGYIEYEKNLLPSNYFGVAPQGGLCKFGNDRGDPNGIIMPDMILDMNTSETNLLFAFCFEDSITSFPKNKENQYLGYTFEIIDTDGTLLRKDVYKKFNKVSDFFEITAGETRTYSAGSDINKFFTSLSYNGIARAIQISFMLKKGQKIRSLSFLYGDLPQKITNAALVKMKEPLEDYITLPYTGYYGCEDDYGIEIGTEHTFEMESQYGTVFSIDYLKNTFICKDEYDGTIVHPDIIEVPDNYFTLGATAKLGTVFNVKLIAVDSQNNVSTITFKFIIVDKKAPNISLLFDDKITVSYNTDFNSSDFIDKYFYINDNYDAEASVEITGGDGSMIPPNTIGSFNCKVIAKDSSGNTSEKTFKMELFDDVAPTIELKADELNLTPFSSISKDSLLSMFDVYDDIDGTIKPEIVEDTYSSSKSVVGDYHFIIKATDKSGNVSEATLLIYVRDTEGPVFYAKKSYITASQGKIPSKEEIVDSLIRQQVVPDKDYVSINVIEGNEINQKLEIGIHEMTLSLIDDEESEYRVRLTLNVLENNDFINEEAKLSFWQKIVAWFKKVFNKIKSFFHK